MSLVPCHVRLCPQPETFARALGLAYDALVHAGHPFDALAVWGSLKERVEQGIYMGQGLLLPHARILGLPEPLMSFSVCPSGFTGISLRAGEVAQFLCVLLSPAESATAHTVAIAGVAKNLLDEDWKKKALAATSEDELKALF